jgi:ribosomal protein L11 methyltransferase
MSDWLEIIVPTTVAAADDVAGLLASEIAAAAAGTEQRADQVVFWVALEAGEQALEDTRRAVAEMAASGLPVDPARVTMRPAVPEEEWRDAWKRHFHVVRLTRRIVIVPSWESYQPAADDLIIHLDPGQAFGTGAHATTRLLLEELQALSDGGARVERFLDVGAGSGILAIAATLLWPGARGVALDIDPNAVAAARDNAERNGVGDRIAASDDPVSAAGGGFELVCANIQSDVLLDLRADITARVAPGGVLLLSGLLAGQVEAVAARYAEGGLTLEATTRSPHDPEWASARLRS